ncbi:Acetyltransferase (GNAT) family protein [Poriferisphaera corsica]|uniref:Acetyltransferase (GNAT) family protein n=1 Tax=Poriferisphaera corsica TaxID=2528020 RepID=A0A517YWS6_9BACT|nr:N-acetyltransferase [Poriferisphaera corsica]QDU34657.1 Acetyltransferase (GNAT) family protein [Poriferisphaera corsica]
MQIRLETTKDEAEIFMLNQAAFSSTSESLLINRLRQKHKLSISLVVEVGGRVVGHIAFSPVTIIRGKQTLAHGIGLAPVAVLPDLQKQGIGSALIYEGIRICTEKKAGFIVVLGDPNYYNRFGFMPASKYRLSDTFGGGDAFQILTLDPATLPDLGGTVHYVSEFDDL